MRKVRPLKVSHPKHVDERALRRVEAQAQPGLDLELSPSEVERGWIEPMPSNGSLGDGLPPGPRQRHLMRRGDAVREVMTGKGALEAECRLRGTQGDFDQIQVCERSIGLSIRASGKHLDPSGLHQAPQLRT